MRGGAFEFIGEADSLRREIDDLAAVLAGLPDDVRAGPFGNAYERRLHILERQLARLCEGGEP